MMSFSYDYLANEVTDLTLAGLGPPPPPLPLSRHKGRRVMAARAEDALKQMAITGADLL